MKKTDQKYYRLFVDDNWQTDVTRERREDDKWDADDLYHHTSINGIYTLPQNDTNHYSDIVVPFFVVPGITYYLVYVTYSTGDSFHSEEGCVKYIDAFETREKAETLAKVIEEHYSFADGGSRWNEKKKKPPKGYNEFTLNYHNEADKAITLHVNWTGYFEQLTSVTVEAVRCSKPGEDYSLIRYRY